MTYSKEEKAMWLEDWQKSGKKAWSYAKENGIKPQTFANWTKKETKEKVGFIEIKPKQLPQFKQCGILIEKEDIKIHLPVGINVTDLSGIITSLRAVL